MKAVSAISDIEEMRENEPETREKQVESINNCNDMPAANFATETLCPPKISRRE
jgi:hypothetical protein